MSRIRVYINPFNPAGSAYTGWIDVTKDTLRDNFGSIKSQLDVSEFDVGIYANSSITLTLRNNHGKYSDVGYGTSMFYFKRADSKVRVTWDPSRQDYNPGADKPYDWLSTEITVYEGLLNDESTQMQLADQTIDFQVLGYESIFDRTLIDSTWAGSLPADNKASTLLKRALAIAAAATNVSILTIDNAQIVPGNDVTWDVITPFTNKTAKEVINTILTASNSVLYLSSVTPIVSARTAGATVAKHFYGPASSLGQENIVDLQNIVSGLNRTFNVVTWTDSGNPPTVNLSSIDATSKGLYGARKKNVTVDGITTTATQQAVIDAIRTEFANPKQELFLSTPMTSSSLALVLLNRVDIDYPSLSIGLNPAQYEHAVYEVDVYATDVNTFLIDQTTPFKIIGMELDPLNNVVILNLRLI